MTSSANSAIRAPTSLGRRFVRYLVGFGVGVGLGAAPFLGALKVPYFSALLEQYPDDMRGSLISFSAFLMGLVAVAIQFASGERWTRTQVRRSFIFVLCLVLACFVWLMFEYDQRVIKVPYLEVGREQHLTVVIAPERRRPPACPCDPVVDDDVTCLQGYLRPSRISQCWGPGPVLRSKRLLRSAYLVITGGLGALIGLLLLQPKPGRRVRRGRGKRQAAPVVAPGGGA